MQNSETHDDSKCCDEGRAYPLREGQDGAGGERTRTVTLTRCCVRQEQTAAVQARRRVQRTPDSLSGRKEKMEVPVPTGAARGLGIVHTEGSAEEDVEEPTDGPGLTADSEKSWGFWGTG